jgi:hypothetical protein
VQTENEKAVRDPMREAFEAKFPRDKRIVFNEVKNAYYLPDVSAPDRVWREANAMTARWEAWQAALQSQVSNTDGWVMVPVEPTPEMLRVAHFEQAEKPFVNNSDRADRVYRAMLSAAPKAPQQVSNTPQDGKPIAWIRFRSNGGYEGPIMDCDKRMAGRRESGVWTPLYCTPPQQQEQSGEPGPLNGIKATMFHDEGAIAQCGYCKRYTLDRRALGDRPLTCDCGKAHGWSGSFQKPTSDALWFGDKPATPTATASQESAPGQEAVYQRRMIGGGWHDVTKDEFDRTVEVHRRIVYLAPPTSTAIAAMVIKQAVEALRDEIYPMDSLSKKESEALLHAVISTLPANAEAELEALMMRVAELRDQESAKGYMDAAYQVSDAAIVRRVLDEKGE